jgi:hypothetical protein
VADLSRVSPGQEFAPDAATWNAFCETAAWADSQRTSSGGRTAGGNLPAGVVLVRNDTGGPINRYAPVCLSAPVCPPVYDAKAKVMQADEFCRVVAMSAVSPWVGSAASLAIMLEPVGAAAFGRAMVRGVTPALCYMADESQRYAGPGVSSPDGKAALRSASSGPVWLLWVQPAADRKPAGSKIAWVYASLGGTGGGSSGDPAVCVKVKGFLGTSGNYYAYSCVRVNSDWSDNGAPFAVYQPIYPLSADLATCLGHAEPGEPLWMFPNPVLMPFADGQGHTTMTPSYLSIGGVGKTCAASG